MSLEMIGELQNKVASLYNKQIDSDTLGSIALEIILKRNEAELELTKTPTKDKKIEIDNKIKILHELETAIVSLHMMQGLHLSHKPFGLQYFKKSKYDLYGKRKNNP